MNFIQWLNGLVKKDYYVDNNYMCESCGSTDGKCDEEGMCYHCHADDWLHMEVYKHGREFFNKMVDQYNSNYFNEKGEPCLFLDGAIWKEAHGVVTRLSDNQDVFYYGI